MRHYIKQILFVIPLLFLLQRCAQQGYLTGGSRDTTPPKLVEAVPANTTVNFKGDDIVLHFDEFVQLKDLTNQLIVTPKIKTTPEIEASGKKIIIKLKKEELKPNTTYRFNFGNAIADMHEANTFKNFEYVFSTGTYLDTLQIKGTITDAYNNKAAPNVLFALYKVAQPNDSLVYNVIPDYISKCDEGGNFVMNYLPYAHYNVFAFFDNNKNLLYDGESEKVGFLSEPLVLKSDTIIQLKLFKEESNKTFFKKTVAPYPGLVQLFLNKKSQVELNTLFPEDKPNILETRINIEKDTILVYYKNIVDTLGLIVKNKSANKTDTLLIALPKENASKRKSKKYTSNISSGKLPLNEKIKLSFLTLTDTSKTNVNGINLFYKKDSITNTIAVKGHWLDATSFIIDNILNESENYTLKTDTNTFFDYKGQKYDSAAFTFKLQNKTEFGKVTLKLLLNKKQSYIVQLINEQELVVIENKVSFSLSSSNAVIIDFIDVTPGTYLVKLIYDDNENGKWDTGNVLLKKQPEKAIIHSKQIKILSDWEVEEEILIKE